MPVPVLQLKSITKRFGDLIANDAISLQLGRGEVLALLGENGAGKSTLVSILFGHYVADAGRIEAFGMPLPPGDPKAALQAGIGMVHQHFALADNLTVLENILIGTESLWQPFSRKREARRRIVEIAGRFGLAVDPDARVGALSVGERQRVEILKALYRGVRILILDEPTAALTPQESEALFDTLRQLVAQGLSLIFISHKLAEVLRVSDRIAVLRGGKLVATRDSAATTREELAELMVGRSVQMPQRVSRATGGVILRLDGVDAADARGTRLLRQVSLEARAGEIVAIAGVAGNGQQALGELLSGMLSAQGGEVTVNGAAMRAAPRDWLAARVARIPEDRQAVGAIGDLPVWENAVSERLVPVRMHGAGGTSSGPARSPFSRFGFIRRAAAKRFARDLVKRFDVRLAGIDQPTRALSGGNMQKLILGRALSVGDAANVEGAAADAAAAGAAATYAEATGATLAGAATSDSTAVESAPACVAPAASTSSAPALVVASKPTWGLDVGAVAYVQRCLLQAAADGAAVLLISEDLDEIFAIADRIAVMHAGRLSAALPAAEWTRATIGMAMAGLDSVPAEAAASGNHAGSEKTHAA